MIVRNDAPYNFNFKLYIFFYFFISLQEKYIRFVKNLYFRYLTDLSVLKGPEEDMMVLRIYIYICEFVCHSGTLCDKKNWNAHSRELPSELSQNFSF